MSTSILELNGTHIGTRVSVVDSQAGVTVSGTLFEVTHEANMMSQPRYADDAPRYLVGRRETRVNLGGVGTLTLSSAATFTSEDAES
jgi:hypothetical protein